ncbi:MAG: hypothetical protein MI723_09050 [Caulobacterales bacterium]|nr:hypothetical protein [Caulobacterales bacterium]
MRATVALVTIALLAGACDDRDRTRDWALAASGVRPSSPVDWPTDVPLDRAYIDPCGGECGDAELTPVGDGAGAGRAADRLAAEHGSLSAPTCVLAAYRERAADPIECGDPDAGERIATSGAMAA